ncbi:macro domain-containing protein [Nodularia sp. UHCC 0506]|uniref:macro domain-containing protein n=1 Tax=Nodularia sp. UHCC 0506 TaxID=3110243 RepID=UPI002B1EF503|nr:macro domain-containing protein [Nodularia sp. UHCC 0506]MEA5517039.1 macro domain-containing protein [Nodularia sp. UHCC 0506]
MSLKIINGNLFTSNCQTLVNTVNCVGVMGAGISLEFRLRYPEMYARYVKICEQNLMEIGKLWLYKSVQHWVLNFPTKQHWKKPSKLEFLELGLQKFVDTYIEKDIISIAFPLLGTQNGGIPQRESLEIMKRYLGECELPIEIYIYDPNAPDDIFSDLKSVFLSLSDREIIEVTSLGTAYIQKVKQAMQDESICNLSKFLSTKGIGITTVQKSLLLLQKFYPTILPNTSQ